LHRFAEPACPPARENPGLASLAHRHEIREGAQMRVTSRSLQSICKDRNFVIRFGRIGCGGGNHGCEGHFGKEVCCAAER
jgi:hypothetical protein